MTVDRRLSEDSLTAVVAANVRRLRTARHWSAEQLAGKLAANGLPWERVTVSKMETGRRSGVTVDELAHLGAVFGVEPWSLTSIDAICQRCNGAPPFGYSCLSCGAGQ